MKNKAEKEKRKAKGYGREMSHIRVLEWEKSTRKMREWTGKYIKRMRFNEKPRLSKPFKKPFEHIKRVVNLSLL